MKNIDIPGYNVTEKIYESSRSIMYRGRRKTDNLPVVIKILNSEYPTPEDIARFKREYEITSILNIEKTIKAFSLEKYKNQVLYGPERGFPVPDRTKISNEPLGFSPAEQPDPAKPDLSGADIAGEGGLNPGGSFVTRSVSKPQCAGLHCKPLNTSFSFNEKWRQTPLNSNPAAIH